MESLAVIAARRVALWLLALCAVLPAWVHASPQAGWWWNPAESGRGFFLEVQGPRMFMSGYFYDEDGRATWLVSNDPMPAANSYDGRLLAFRDGQSLLGDYRHPSAAADAGAVSLRFSDDTHGTLTWPGGSVAIERYDFHHGAPAAFQPRTGWWWNPDESGRGFSIEMQGDHMFVGAYMYDAAGNPVWYVADALMETPTRFNAPLLQFANGQTMGGAYHAPTPPAFIGNITIDFSAPDTATVTLSDESPKLATKSAKAIPIKPQYVKPTVEVAQAPKHWRGSLLMVVHGVDDSGDIFTWRGEAPSVAWDLDDEELQGLAGGYPGTYKIRQGSFVVADVNGASPACTTTGSGSADLTQGKLTVNADGSYSGNVSQQVLIHGTETCRIDETHTITVDVTIPLAFPFVFAGHLDGGAINGSDVTTQDEVTITRTWSFGPVME